MASEWPAVSEYERLLTDFSLMSASFLTSDTFPSAVTSLAVTFNLLYPISKMKSPRRGCEFCLLMMTRERAFRRLLGAVSETVNLI